MAGSSGGSVDPEVMDAVDIFEEEGKGDVGR